MSIDAWVCYLEAVEMNLAMTYSQQIQWAQISTHARSEAGVLSPQRGV
jgi:hypothetical protein